MGHFVWTTAARTSGGGTSGGNEKKGRSKSAKAAREDGRKREREKEVYSLAGVQGCCST